MKIYILDQRKDNTKHNAVGKAMTDVFEVMGNQGVVTVPGMPKDASKFLKVFDLLVLSFYSVFKMGRGDFCIFVYQDNAVKIKLLAKLKKIRGFKTICFVNDVNSIRSDGLYSQERAADIDRDFSLIGSADIIMAPNRRSVAYMKERNISSEMVTVDVWDYLMDEQMGEKCDDNVRFVKPIVKSLIAGKDSNGVSAADKRWKIGFAGNLGKSEFLDELDTVISDNIEYHLWGDTEGKEFKNNSVIYEGSVAPNVLPLELSEKCNIGLVWDGKRAGSIEGGYGEYLRFNNSHKCGCYLASGIPVFVWKESGMSDFVEENGCGFVIDSLADIPGILANISDEAYENMMENVARVAKRIRSGCYLADSLAKATGKEE